ncbi:Cap15 family cyclic dinucleotide receptor domain-containing protein [Kribbella swartbergensis]
MKRSILVRVVAGIVVLVAMGGAWLSAGVVDLGWLKYFSGAVFIATALLGLWDTWIWRWPLVQRLPGVPPNLRGTWEGLLTSFWVDPATGKSPDPKTVYLVIRQTASLVSAKLLTNESRSSSSLGSVTTIDHSSELIYMYINRPDARVEHRSRMHHGSTALDVTGKPARRLRGRYWTDRDSKGELDFTQRKGRFADDFEAAVEIFKSS